MDAQEILCNMSNITYFKFESIFFVYRQIEIKPLLSPLKNMSQTLQGTSNSRTESESGTSTVSETLEFSSDLNKGLK